MPQAIPFVIGAVKVFAATVATKGIVAALASTIIGQLITSVAISFIANRLSPRPQVPSFEDPGLQFQVQAGGAIPRQFIYGEALVAGHIVAAKVSGEDRVNLDMIIVIGDGGPYEAINQIRFDDELLTLDSNGNVTSPSKYAGKARIVTTLGAEDQAGIGAAQANISEWTTEHRGRGVCHAYVRMVWDPEVWTNGRPTIYFRVRGRKVYDPRKDSTKGGSGAHRVNDPATWEWSQNPALWALDWLLGVKMNGKRIAGFGVSAMLINYDSFSAAADVCDEAVDVKGGGTIARYTGGGALVSADDDPKSVADSFVMAMAGEFSPRSGYIGVFAGGPRTAVVTLNDDDLAGPIRLATTKSIRETVNEMSALYREPADDYEMIASPAYTNSTWETEDGENLPREIRLPFTDDHRRAQRISKMIAAREREPRRIEAVWKQKALQVREGDAFTWSSASYPSSVTGKYICESRGINADGTVSIIARSETTANYGWDEDTEERDREPGARIARPEDEIPIPPGPAPDWNDIPDRPVELTDGRIGTAIDSDAKLFVGGYELYRTFSQSADGFINDASSTGKVICRVDPIDVRARNSWALFSSLIVFDTHNTGTMGAGETATFRIEMWITGPDGTPIDAAGNFGALTASQFQERARWTVVLNHLGAIAITNQAGIPVTTEQFNQELASLTVNYPLAYIGNAHKYLVGRWISSTASDTTGIALAFTSDTTLAMMALINVTP